ncbi:MAG: ATP12 family protein [Pseudomonadota bacterium]
MSGGSGVGGWGGAPRRFYETAAIGPGATPKLFIVLLDGKPLRCPSGAAFAAPRAVAEAAAAEWSAVGERVDPGAMPVTRAVNTAIDQVAPQREAVIDEIAGYGASDLVCYRATEPKALAEREAAAWDPMLAWAESAFGAKLRIGAGITPVAQSADALAALRAATAARSDLGLTALSALTSLTGSLILGLAAAAQAIEAEAAWDASRIEETFQQERWGRDAEAEAAAAARREGFMAAARLARLLDESPVRITGSP